jgi:hypothetical protein
MEPRVPLRGTHGWRQDEEEKPKLLIQLFTVCDEVARGYKNRRRNYHGS